MGPLCRRGGEARARLSEAEVMRPRIARHRNIQQPAWRDFSGGRDRPLLAVLHERRNHPLADIERCNLICRYFADARTSIRSRAPSGGASL